MAQNILTLTSEEALDHFARSEQYLSCELPEYFKFDALLAYVRKQIGDRNLDECLAKVSPDDCPGVNLDLLLNKDGQYGVRPLTLINPYLYWLLVKELCSPEGWAMTHECFDCYRVDNLEACALPVVRPEGVEDKFYAATAILNWWSTFEQRSLELSLQYRYMFVTDITNCYGSIIPQSIEWAFNRKGTAKAVNSHSARAGRVQQIVRAIQQGRNVGIPQGSVICDLLAEFVLGYADRLLHERLAKAGIDGYHILRYRDDYRVFCNDRNVLEDISYEIQHVLESLNLRLNTAKTKISSSIVIDSIKPDKRYYIENTPILNKRGCDFDGIQKHLLYILMFGRKYPNGGQLNRMLSDLDKIVERKLRPRKIRLKIGEPIDILGDDDKDKKEDKKEDKKASKGVFDKLPKYIDLEEPRHIVENVKALAAVGTQIAIDNVTKVHYALRVVSRIVDSLTDNDLKWEIFDQVCARLINRPNSDYDKIWLQNITYQRDKAAGQCPYDVPLCQLVMGKRIQLWNNQWLKPSLTKGLPLASVCDKKLLKDLTPVITFRETRAYYDL